jgi:hypothetical protein
MFRQPPDLGEDATASLLIKAVEAPLEFGRDLHAIGHGFLMEGSGLVRRARWLARAARMRSRNRGCWERR